MKRASLFLVLLLVVSAFILCLPRSLHPMGVLMFPMGMAELCERILPYEYDSGLVIYGTWILYGCLGLAFLSIPNRKVCLRLFVFAALLVAINSVGCHFVVLGRGA